MNCSSPGQSPTGPPWAARRHGPCEAVEARDRDVWIKRFHPFRLFRVPDLIRRGSPSSPSNAETAHNRRFSLHDHISVSFSLPPHRRGFQVGALPLGCSELRCRRRQSSA